MLFRVHNYVKTESFFQSQAHTVMYMLQSATTTQVFQDIKLSMHKDPAAAHASNPESTPNPPLD